MERSRTKNIIAWTSLIMLIMIFSGVFQNAEGPWRALDFNTLAGKFGRIGGAGDFRGTGGVGAKEGFLFALTLIPTTMLALGLIEVAQELGGLEVASKLFTPLLKPLMGLPGAVGLTFVSTFTSSDVGAVMTKEHHERKEITSSQRATFVAYQYAGSGVVNNTLTGGAPLIAVSIVPVGMIILIQIIVKIIGANIVRAYCKHLEKKENKQLDTMEVQGEI